MFTAGDIEAQPVPRWVIELAMSRYLQVQITICRMAILVFFYLLFAACRRQRWPAEARMLMFQLTKVATSQLARRLTALRLGADLSFHRHVCRSRSLSQSLIFRFFCSSHSLLATREIGFLTACLGSERSHLDGQIFSGQPPPIWTTIEAHLTTGQWMSILSLSNWNLTTESFSDSLKPRRLARMHSGECLRARDST
jgi:hypothetical protein